MFRFSADRYLAGCAGPLRHAIFLFAKLAGDRLFLPTVSPFGKSPADIDEAACAQGMFHPFTVIDSAGSANLPS
jgi:hypothetical protein